MSHNDMLSSWNEGSAKAAIIAFVDETVARAVPTAARIATFDADGTLWCERPMPVQADFILRRLEEMAKTDASLRDRQPWKAAYEHDNAWLASAITEHYAGDEEKVKTLLEGVTTAFAGVEVEAFEAQSDAFLRSAKNPSLDRGYLTTAYQPMVDLLRYLKANGFSNHIVSGSGGDFMRPITKEVFGIPPERVIGSASALQYQGGDTGGSITHKGELGFLDDGPQKPLHIWSRVGRRPLVAGGNSNGDIPMLDFAQHQGVPSLRLLVLHDDAEREFAYTSGAEEALEKADANGWTVVSMKNDFTSVFGEQSDFSPG